MTDTQVPMTAEQFAKCREFAKCYTTSSDMLGLASGMIGSLLAHIDAITKEAEANLALAYAKLDAAQDQTVIYGDRIATLTQPKEAPK